MGLFSRVRQRVGGWIAGTTDAAYTSPGSDFTNWFSPSNVFASISAGTLATSEDVFAAVSKLSNSMGSLPLALYDGQYNQQTSTAAKLLLDSPNPNMHRWEFVRTLEVMRNTDGNGYALKEYDSRYQPKALWVLDPTRVTPLIEKASKELWYKVETDSGTYYIHNADMIHVRHVSAAGGTAGLTYDGISPLDVLTNTIQFDSEVREFSLDQVESSVRASFILNMATMLDDAKKESVLSAFRSFYADNGGVLLEEQGTKITPIEQKFLDTKVFEVEKITVARVARVYGLPDPGATAYNSREQEALRYVQETMVPIATQYEAELGRKLLSTSERARGLHFKFDMGSLLRADTATLGDFLMKMVRTGAMTPSQAANALGYSAYPEGDKHFMSRDLAPVGSQQIGAPNV